MKHHRALGAIALFALLGLTQAQAQENQLLATGSGSIGLSQTKYPATFEFWGTQKTQQLLDDQSQIKILVPRKGDEGKVEVTFTLVWHTGENVEGGEAETKGQWRLTPCDDGVCPCEMEEVEVGKMIAGSCSNQDHPDHGQLEIEISGITKK